MFYSLGPGFGSLITLSSYNRFNNNILRDAILIVIGDVLHSLIAGCMVFTFLGGLAKKWDMDVLKVIQDGPALIFVVLMEALSEIGPVPQILSFMFSLMLLVLGLDSVTAMNETLISALMDHFQPLRKHRSKELNFQGIGLKVTSNYFLGWVVISICFISFLLGISLCFSGGFFMFILMDDWLNFWNAIIICLLEVIIVSWVYGIDKFCQNVQEMGVKSTVATEFYFKACLRFVVPTILVILLFGSLGNISLSKAHIRGIDYVFEEPYVQALAWLMGIFTISFIPCFAFWQMFSTFKIRNTIDWSIFHPTSKWKPQNEDDSVIKLNDFSSTNKLPVN